MNFVSVLIVAQEIPGRAMVERLGQSLEALAAALLFVAFLVFAVVIMFSMLPRWAGGLLGLLIISSIFLSPGVWWDWIVYVASGDIETAEPDGSSDDETGPGGG